MGFPLGLLLFHGLAVFYLKEPLLEQLSRSLFIHVLTAFFLDEDLQVGRYVDRPAGRLDLIDGLASWSARAGELILDILLVDLKGKGNYRHDNHRNCTGVQSAFGLRLRDSDYLMHACLALQYLVAAFALHAHIQEFVTRADSGLFA